MLRCLWSCGTDSGVMRIYPGDEGFCARMVGLLRYKKGALQFYKRKFYYGAWPKRSAMATGLSVPSPPIRTLPSLRLSGGFPLQSLARYAILDDCNFEIHPILHSFLITYWPKTTADSEYSCNCQRAPIERNLCTNDYKRI